MIEDLHTSDTRWIEELIQGRHGTRRSIPMGRGSVTGTISTKKAHRAQKTESNLERDLVILLDWDRRIERLATQPFQINFRNDMTGRDRHYTPDVIVKYRQRDLSDDELLRHTIFEVKPHHVLKQNWSLFKPKFRAAVQFARAREMRFSIVTEHEIRIPRLRNLIFLRRFRTDYMPVANSEMNGRRAEIRRSLQISGATTPALLLDAITTSRAEQAHLIPWIWQLVDERVIGIDLDSDLTMSLSIWLERQA